jgi:hypothetical protein
LILGIVRIKKGINKNKIFEGLFGRTLTIDAIEVALAPFEVAVNGLTFLRSMGLTFLHSMSYHYRAR